MKLLLGITLLQIDKRGFINFIVILIYEIITLLS